MHSIPGEEDTPMRIEIGTDPLANLKRRKISTVYRGVGEGERKYCVLPYLISSPPVAVLIIDLVRVEDLLGGLKDKLGGDFRAIRTATRIGCDLFQLDIKAHQPVFSRDDHQAAALDRVNSAPHADVG